MKPKFYSILFGILILLSCSKKNENIAQTNSVTINGTIYNTVKIGNQTWTTTNYNGAGGINYNGTQTNDATLGKLYTLDEAKAVILPTGWRLPTEDDWNTLVMNLGSPSILQDGTYLPDSVVVKLMAKTGWTTNEGSGASGFNALPAGTYSQVYTPTNQIFMGLGTAAIFLSSSTYPGTPIPANFFISNVNHVKESAFGGFIVQAADRGSIRFVKDN